MDPAYVVAIANQESKRRARSASDQASWRACCAAQAPFGFWVQPSRCTRSLPSSMKNRTYSLVERTVSRVKKSQAIRLAA
jgi:hypothetical protein